MKKKNLLITVLSFALLSFTFNVNASNSAVDSTKCKDEKVYTNYYFFLDAGNTESGKAAIPETYTTIGYYKNTVLASSLASVVNEYGFFSDEFAAVAERTRGIVPISTSNPTQSLSIDGVGLRTFYTLMTGTATSSGTDAYLVEHNWSKQQGQIVKQTDNYTISFNSSQINDMMNATLMVTNFTIGVVEDSSYPELPVAFQIIRKYEEGFTPSLSEITPVEDSATNSSWYIQPALYYVQYCEKVGNTSNGESFVIKYDGNATDAKNVPSTSAQTNVGTCANVSSKKPTLDGYTFLGWSTDKNATSADSKYAAGECYKGENGDLTLYAVWKKGTVQNPGTGIASHVIAYVAVIALGISGLALARKKGLFRQI